MGKCFFQYNIIARKFFVQILIIPSLKREIQFPWFIELHLGLKRN